MDLIEFDDMDRKSASIIKVVGVGGGGGNAVNHMYEKGIRDVTYLICNTDNQALRKSPIPDKLQLGPKTTKGLGAGNKPEVAAEAAKESEKEICDAFGNDTQMVFVTAGMGGGTGTGAAPEIARIARSMDILTVGIVTIPFSWEGNKKINQALEGVERMSENVDALLVVNNDLLTKIYSDLTAMNGFKKADDTLLVAAKSIAEIITVPGYINLDFADVKTILKDGGVAVMSAGQSQGVNRLKEALEKAIKSPLLNNADVYHARKVLFNISCSHSSEITFGEMEQIKTFMSQFEGFVDEVIWGIAFDDELKEDLKVTLLASGFSKDIDPLVKDFNDKKSADALEQQRKAEERSRRLRDKYYGGNINVRSVYKPFIFDEASLDDDEQIEKIWNEPAFMRKD